MDDDSDIQRDMADILTQFSLGSSVTAPKKEDEKLIESMSQSEIIADLSNTIGIPCNLNYCVMTINGVTQSIAMIKPLVKEDDMKMREIIGRISLTDTSMVTFNTISNDSNANETHFGSTRKRNEGIFTESLDHTCT